MPVFHLLLFCVMILTALPASITAQQVTITGVVTDDNRNPISGASVISVEDSTRYWTQDEMGPVGRATTNNEGRFTITLTTAPQTALIAWSPAHRRTKFLVNPRNAQNRVIGLPLDKGYTFTGRVFDRDSNEPVVGAAIGPLVPAYDTLQDRINRAIPVWAQSDTEGNFTLEGVATDISHTVVVQAPGYETKNIDLSQGQTSLDIPMDKGGSAVHGEVFARDASAPGGIISFSGTVVRANGNGFDIVTRTDAEGKFALSGLPSGEWTVEPLNLPDERAARPQTISMPRENNTSVSLEVSAGYYLTGTIIDDETDRPANGVPISFLDRWTTSTTNGSFRMGPFYQPMQVAFHVAEQDGWQHVSTDTGNEYDSSDGFSDLAGIAIRVRRQRTLDVTVHDFDLTTQPLTLHVLPPAGATQRFTLGTSTSQVALFTSGSHTVYGLSGGLATMPHLVDVDNRANIPVELHLSEAASAAGLIQLTNTDETTRVQNFKVSMAPVINQTLAPPVINRLSPRIDGHFFVQAAPPGSYILTVENETATRRTTHPITLLPGANTLPPIAWEAGNRLSGYTVSSDGAPIPFAQITLAQPGDETLRIASDENGYFRAYDLEHPQLVSLTAEANGFTTTHMTDVHLPFDDGRVIMALLGRIAVTVEAPASTTWDVHLVRMAPWGVGAHAAQLLAHSIFTRPVQGGETLETSLEEHVTLRAIAVSRGGDQAVAIGEQFEWAGEQSTGTAIVLSPGASGSLSGTVAASGTAVEVTAMNTAIPDGSVATQTEFAVTTSNGRYQLSGLPPGNYLLLGAGEGYSGYALNVELPAGGAVTANLDALETNDLTGVVTWNGDPVPGATVQIISETDAQSQPQTATTTANGEFIFHGITPDSYAVSTTILIEETERPASRSVVVKAGAAPPVIEFALSAPRMVQFGLDARVSLGSDEVRLMNKATREVTLVEMGTQGLQADVPPGDYEVWSGDAVVGVATVTEDGKGTIAPAPAAAP